ncbi:MAG: response regulator transcription factor, partial [Acidimicrobiales bacterium]
MKVIVVDDMVLVREGIVRILRDHNIEVVAAAGSAEPLIALVDAHDPDVVILDIRMPPTFTDEGLRAAADLRATRPRTAVLVLSQYLDAAYALQLLREAPERVGYLLKDRIMELSTLTDALRRLVEGETVIDPTIVTRLLGRRRQSDNLASLTTRELEVLGLLAEGLSNRAIATRLGVNERTVESHTTQVFQKIGLEPSTEIHRRVLAVLTYLRVNN